MEKIGEETTVTVSAVPLWDAPGVLLGYFVALIGPALRTGSRTLYTAALHHNTYWNHPIQVHESAAEALQEWEEAAPRALPQGFGERNHIPNEQIEEINARGLFRERKRT